MKILPFLICPVLLGACTSMAPRQAVEESEDFLVTGFPDLPADARGVAERLASCRHFSGEFGGDDSGRDHEVNAAMEGLRCDTVDVDTTTLRSKYRNDKAVQDALDQADSF